MRDHIIDSRWLGSVYALLSVAICILVFSWSNAPFLMAFLKTVLISIAFYIIGVVFGSVLGVVVSMKENKDKSPIGEEESEQGAE